MPGGVWSRTVLRCMQSRLRALVVGDAFHAPASALLYVCPPPRHPLVRQREFKCQLMLRWSSVSQRHAFSKSTWVVGLTVTEGLFFDNNLWRNFSRVAKWASDQCVSVVGYTHWFKGQFDVTSLPCRAVDALCPAFQSLREPASKSFDWHCNPFTGRATDFIFHLGFIFQYLCCWIIVQITEMEPCYMLVQATIWDFSLEPLEQGLGFLASERPGSF